MTMLTSKHQQVASLNTGASPSSALCIAQALRNCNTYEIHDTCMFQQHAAGQESLHPR